MVVAVTCRQIGGHLPFGFVMRQSIAAFKHIIGAKRQKFSHQLKKSAINCHPMGKHLPLYRSHELAKVRNFMLEGLTRKGDVRLDLTLVLLNRNRLFHFFLYGPGQGLFSYLC
jgi:hypothetical protein